MVNLDADGLGIVDKISGNVFADSVKTVFEKVIEEQQEGFKDADGVIDKGKKAEQKEGFKEMTGAGTVIDVSNATSDFTDKKDYKTVIAATLTHLVKQPELQGILFDEHGKLLKDGIETIAGLDPASDKGWNGLPADKRSDAKLAAQILTGQNSNYEPANSKAPKIMDNIFGADGKVSATKVQGYLEKPETIPDVVLIMDSKEGIRTLANNEDIVDAADGSEDGNFSIMGIVAISQNAKGEYSDELVAAANGVLQDEGIMAKIDGEKDKIQAGGHKRKVQDGLFSKGALGKAADAAEKGKTDSETAYWTENLALPSEAQRDQFIKYSEGSVLDGFTPYGVGAEGGYSGKYTYINSDEYKQSEPLEWMNTKK